MKIICESLNRCRIIINQGDEIQVVWGSPVGPDEGEGFDRSGNFDLVLSKLGIEGFWLDDEWGNPNDRIGIFFAGCQDIKLPSVLKMLPPYGAPFQGQKDRINLRLRQKVIPILLKC